MPRLTLHSTYSPISSLSGRAQPTPSFGSCAPLIGEEFYDRGAEAVRKKIRKTRRAAAKRRDGHEPFLPKLAKLIPRRGQKEVWGRVKPDGRILRSCKRYLDLIFVPLLLLYAISGSSAALSEFAHHRAQEQVIGTC